MKKKNFIVAAACSVLIMLSALPVQAKRVELQKAEELARRYAQARRGTQSKTDVKLKHTVKKHGAMPDGTTAQSAQNTVHYYVFDINSGDTDGGGFVIIAGDDAVRPVLGYTENGSYDEDNMPPNFAYWMDYLKEQISYAQEEGLEQSESIRLEWDRYLSGELFAAENEDSVIQPLLKTKWNQTAPYNNYAPLDSNGARTATGCVATAMAQIMKYHKWPIRGTGSSDPYTTRRHSIDIPSVNFEVNYNWDNMLDNYIHSIYGSPEQRSAVAELMYHAGVSVKTDYGPSSSAISNDVLAALTAHFGYDRSIRLLKRQYYDNDTWDEIIKTQLRAGIPVYYSTSGHAFICDGYKGDGRFYFNWGWGGRYDGDYLTTLLNPGDFVFRIVHEIIINIKPDEGVSDYEIELTDFSVNKHSVAYNDNEIFEVSVKIKNVATFDTLYRNSYLGVALADSNNNIITIAEQKTITSDMPPNPHLAFNFTFDNCVVPPSVEPGQYRLIIVTKTADADDWRIVTQSANGINHIDFSVSTVTSVISETALIRPQSNNAHTFVPITVHADIFSAGPNPVSRSSGAIAFYRQGRPIRGTLSVYDAAGNVVKKITVRDPAAIDQTQRQIGSWDLTDKKGRPVADGTYLVRGTVKTADGKREKISLVLGVR